ncbi:MAG: Ldh family oxidoreductase, partial [Pseudomonadota bacterium]
AAAGAGAIRAFGDHKGSGLAFMCEMLGGALTAGGTSGPIAERARIANGMLSIFLSPKHFGTQAEFERMGLAYAEWVSGCTPASPDAPVLLPGEKENSVRADRLANGVPLPRAAWDNIQATARRLGVTQ